MMLLDTSGLLCCYHAGEPQHADKDELGIDDPKCHSLVGCLTTEQYFQKWLKRIEQIPNLMIEEVVEQGCAFADRHDHYLSQREMRACKEFLIVRKGRLVGWCISTKIDSKNFRTLNGNETNEAK